MMAVFEKGARLRHIGHLDIQRAMQRALRRSGLPVSYSKGFNPHILLTFASALATGAMGEKEILDVSLDAPVEADAFMTAMNAALPPDMQLSFAKPLEDRHPALMAMVRAADYELTLQDEDAARTLAQAAGAPEPRIVHVASDELIREKPELRESLLGDQAQTAVFDNSKLRRFVPGFRFLMPYRDGVRRTILYMDAHPECQEIDEDWNAWVDEVVRRHSGD